ncbi:hypothetical protein NLN86_24395 [Citrobacter portucalensis]|uniref:Cell envelope biogenesis protein TolA n=1 Tax=Citrobacter portucalensis TaxID=1639133 RepID=A0AAW5W7Z8_9ENTR|nr:hypothetical protein [Citrobacter portucalensis]MCX9004755.1 hypothetical protein [Citrobacter portucalensis]
MSESKELVLVTLPAAADLEAAFISDEYITNLIADIRQKASSVVGDVATVKGRGVYISMASTVRRTKTVIDDAGKKLVAEMKKRPALVDASRKKVRDELDALAVEIRRPATEWEAEQDRLKAEEEARIAAEELAKKVETDHEIALLMNDAFDRETKAKVEEAERQRVAHEEELKRQAAEQAKREAEEKAAAELAAAQQREADAIAAKAQAELLAKQAQERAEREAKDAQERTAKLAQEAREQAEREKQEAIAAEQRKAQEKEAARLAEEKRIADEAAKRAEDVEHRRGINAAAVQSLIDQGIPDDWAKACVVAIARGKVPATTINY